MRKLSCLLLAFCVLLSACTPEPPENDAETIDLLTAAGLVSKSFSNELWENACLSLAQDHDQNSQVEKIVQDAFEVWRSFDQNIEAFFTNDQELNIADLVEIYSRHCMSLGLTEQLTTLPDFGGTIFSREDLRKFSETYFDFNFDEDFEVYRLEKIRTAYVEEADCFYLSPTPPIPITIQLEEYSMRGNLIEMVISYQDAPEEYNVKIEAPKKGLLTVLAEEDGFKFKSFEILESEFTIETSAYDYEEMIELLTSTGLVFWPFSAEEPVDWGGYLWESMAKQINHGDLEADHVDEIGREYYCAEKVEGLLAQHFYLRPEPIRGNDEEYDAELHMYMRSEGLGGVPAAYMITGARIDGQTLTLTYDLYRPSGTEYLCTCTTIIDLSKDSWKYRSHCCKPTLEEIWERWELENKY